MRSYRVLTADRAAEIVAAIRGMPWEPGRSAREHGKVKRTMELRADKCPEAKPYLDEIAQAIGKCGVFEREHIEAAHYPRFSLYAGGGEYRIHTDAAYMGRTRTDVALTLFLTDDFEGGELCIDGVLPGGKPARAKAPAGVAVAYECWRPHWVEPVTKGERIVVITWLQSRVRNAADREVLGRLQSVIDDIEHQTMSAQERFAHLGAVHEHLKKRWSA